MSGHGSETDAVVAQMKSYSGRQYTELESRFGPPTRSYAYHEDSEYQHFEYQCSDGIVEMGVARLPDHPGILGVVVRQGAVSGIRAIGLH